MNAPLVSILVPVYNVAPYLEQCLRSIQEQTYPHFEAILINDGSTDASGDICRRFAREDSRFLLLDKENTGVSHSRDLGLERASGKYLQFADGDDYLPPDTTETFLHRAESTGSDLVISHFYRLAGGRFSPKGHIKGERLLTRQEYAEEMVKAPANYYYGVLWNKFYRRSVIDAAHLRFDPEIRWCEDFLFNLEYISHARLIATTPKPLYYYRKREDSIVSSQVSLRKVIQMKQSTFQSYKELYQRLDLYEEEKGRIYRYFLSTAVDGAVSPLSPKVDGGRTLPKPRGKR